MEIYKKMTNQTQNFMDTIYGPLPKDYCLYFYLLSIVGFISMVFTLLVALFIGITKKKDFTFFLKATMAVLAYGILYFQNRLLYSMCVGSLN